MPEIAWRALRFCGARDGDGAEDGVAEDHEGWGFGGAGDLGAPGAELGEEGFGCGIEFVRSCGASLRDWMRTRRRRGTRFGAADFFWPGGAERLVRSQTVSSVASSGVRPSWVIAAFLVGDVACLRGCGRCRW